MLIKIIKNYMKHIRKFNNYENNINESIDNKLRIEEEIEKCISKYNEYTDQFIKYDIENLRDKLLNQAKDNKYRGSVVIRSSKGPNFYNKKFIVYEPKKSFMQEIGSAANGF